MAVSIRCSPASTAEPVGTFRSGSQRQVSIRCSPASTAEPDSSVEHQQLGCFYSLLASEYSGTRRVTRWSCARRGFYSLLASEYSGTGNLRSYSSHLSEFLFAARQRVQRNPRVRGPYQRLRFARFLFAARQRVQRNAARAAELSKTGQNSFYSLLASEYSGTRRSARPDNILRNVSIRCSPASTAERDDASEIVEQMVAVSIRCSPASTAER